MPLKSSAVGVNKLVKLTTRSLLLSFVLLYSLPLHATSQQIEAAPDIADPSAVQLAHPTEVLLKRISKGQASIADIKIALQIGKPGDIANVFSALYTMRRDPRIRGLMFDVWRDIRKEHADLPWEKLQHPVIRTSLAAVMNRIAAGTISEFLDYLRAQADSEIDLVRAQVALALGMTGYLEDLPQLKRYAEGESFYVAQSAIVGLGYVYRDEAKQVLLDLHEKYKGSVRGVYIAGMLQEAYQWKP